MPSACPSNTVGFAIKRPAFGEGWLRRAGVFLILFAAATAPQAAWSMGLQQSEPQSAGAPPQQASTEPPSSFGAITPYLGLAIDAIEFPRIGADEAASLLTTAQLKIGTPLTRDGLHDAMQALFATGRFADIQAEAERTVIRFGIGINGGEVIVGDIGYGENVAFTALGDAVNVAARLQDMSKELECEVVISDEVYQTAGLPRDQLQLKEITIRGRAAPIVVRTVLKAENLATLFEQATTDSAAAA